jgi:DNA-damage-inducible protein J
MDTIQVNVDKEIKQRADILFSKLGLDTPTAIKIFLTAALDYDGIPFPIKHRSPNSELYEAIEDSRLRRNLSGPFDSAEDAVRSMLEN